MSAAFLKNFSRISRFVLVAFLLSVLGTGCERSSSPLPLQSKHAQLKNNVQAVDLFAIPAGYSQVSEGLYSKPIVLPSDSSGQRLTRFRSVTDTGVDFKNFFKRTSPLFLVETGSGVAVADFDNDGLNDIYLTGSDVANKLYRNLGGFKFEDVTDKAGVDGRINGKIAWASGASFADIDNDGDLDLYVCNMAASNMLFINQNDGTFIEQSIVRGANYRGASKQAAFCDYDRDGDLDFYLVTYQDLPPQSDTSTEMVDGVLKVIPGNEEHVQVLDGHEIRAGEQDHLFENQGDGTFVDVTDAAGIAGFDLGLGGIWLDYDDDGWQDFYVGSDFMQSDHLYKNNRDGTFTDVLPATFRHTTWSSMGLDAGDLNNDGFIDLAVADMADQTHFGQKMNMGEMGKNSWFLTRGRPRQFPRNCVFVGAGNGQFMEAASIANLDSSDWTWSIRMVDLNNNGRLDVFITNGHSRDHMNSDRIIEMEAMRRDPNTTAAQLAEFAASVPPRRETNMAFENMGDLNFETAGEKWGLDHNGVSHSVSFGDLDNDGDLDAVVNNYYEPSIVYENLSNEGGRVIVELRCRDNNSFGIGSKLELWQGEQYFRRDLNPSRGYLSADPLVAHFGVDPDKPIERLKVTWPNGTQQEFTELTPNHIYRVIESANPIPIPESKPSSSLFANVTAGREFKFKHQESEFDDYSREPLLPFQLSRLGSGAAWGDVNGDGWPDVYCQGAAGQSGQLMMNDGGKKFQPAAGPWSKHADREDMGAVFFDVDADGDVDLYVVSGSNECAAGDSKLRDRLYLNNGDGTFVTANDNALPDLTDSGICATAADFDRDGDLDLFVGSRSIPGKYPLTPTSRLLVNNQGVFSEAAPDIIAELSTVGLVNSALWSDYNDDGWIDLILALEWGPITVLENNQGVFKNVTPNIGLDRFHGWWHGIAGADLDRDGDIDYVVTNHGLNTKYHCQLDKPQRLYYDDFDNNGTLDLVEAEFEGDVEYPVRGRSCSSKCMPFIAEKFGTYRDYSLATISDIYETDTKKRPVLEANFLENAVLWNEGNGQLRLEALPRLSNISPAYGVAIADFDNDSHPDILIANNFFGSQPETGYMDGGVGWLLKGKGNHQFEISWPNISGFYVTEDTKGLALADFDNDGDFDALFAQNNDSFQLYENRSNPQYALTVNLVGPPENVNAIGCRIKLDHGDYARVIENYAGGSYLSQSDNGPIRLSSTEMQDLQSVTVEWNDGTISTAKIEDRGTKELTVTYKNKTIEP